VIRPDATPDYRGAVFPPRRRALLVLSVLSAVLLASGCSSDARDIAAPAPSTTGTAVAGGDGVQTITVTGDDQMRFQPSVIKAKPGKLRITLRTIGGTPHDLQVQPSKINTGLVAKGQERSLDVTLASGRYDFICTFHVTSNMVGVIDVS
jgi:plastocyanin